MQQVHTMQLDEFVRRTIEVFDKWLSPRNNPIYGERTFETRNFVAELKRYFPELEDALYCNEHIAPADDSDPTYRGDKEFACHTMAGLPDDIRQMQVHKKSFEMALDEMRDLFSELLFSAPDNAPHKFREIFKRCVDMSGKQLVYVE
jgi:hypothetical protein